MPLVIDARIPLSLKRSPWHPTLERPILINEEGVEEEGEQGSRALKRRRRQYSPPLVPVEVSSEGSLSASQLNSSSAKVTKEVRKGFNHE